MNEFLLETMSQLAPRATRTQFCECGYEFRVRRGLEDSLEYVLVWESLGEMDRQAVVTVGARLGQVQRLHAWMISTGVVSIASKCLLTVFLPLDMDKGVARRVLERIVGELGGSRRP